MISLPVSFGFQVTCGVLFWNPEPVSVVFVNVFYFLIAKTRFNTVSPMLVLRSGLSVLLHKSHLSKSIVVSLVLVLILWLDFSRTKSAEHTWVAVGCSLNWVRSGCKTWKDWQKGLGWWSCTLIECVDSLLTVSGLLRGTVLHCYAKLCPRVTLSKRFDISESTLIHFPDILITFLK